MDIIRTVCGDIAQSELGFCHSHEHIMLAKGKPFTIDPSLCMDDYGKSLDELRLFKSSGGSSIVDCQPVGAGRMSKEQSRLSKECGVHIVASTGFHKAMFYDDGHFIFTWDKQRLTELFLHELTAGMYLGTENALPHDYHDCKAGAIKVAYDIAGLNGHYVKLFSAAAAAQVQTGAPMVIHIDNGSNPLVLDDFLSGAGVAPHKRIYCHLDRAVPDIAVHIELCKRGAYLEYDTICRLKYHGDDKEISIIRHILDAGFESRILLGMDATNRRLKSYGGEIGLDYINNTFIPKMQVAGIDSAQAFMVDNPMRAFSFTP